MRAALDHVAASSSVSATRNSRYERQTVERVGSGKRGMARAKVRLVLVSSSYRAGMRAPYLLVSATRWGSRDNIGRTSHRRGVRRVGRGVPPPPCGGRG